MKRRKVAGWLLMLALLSVLAPRAAQADSGPIYFSLGVPVPTTSNTICMTRETLAIDYTEEPAPYADGGHLVSVHARFWFRNEGQAVTQQMGFPLGREVLSGFGYFDYGFSATVDGTAIKTAEFTSPQNTSGSELTYTMWRAFQVPFAAGQTRLLDVHYKINPRDGYFLYVLQTGRLWKGPIGDLSIDVNFRRAPVFPDLLSVQPTGYHVQGTHLLWHFTDYEPEQDIEIESMDPAFWQAVRPLKETAERTGTPAAWYRYALALLPENIVGAYGSTTTIAGKSVPMSFVRGLQSSAYADYVQRTLLSAFNHCAHGSMQQRVLTAGYNAHFSYARAIGNFLAGVDTWETNLAMHAHAIQAQLLQAGTSKTQPSADEARLLTWLEVNMAGESMSAGYSLSGVHELEQAQVYAAQAGLLKNAGYESLLKSVTAYLSPWMSGRLLINVASVPRIEVQQQKMSLANGTAWRARITLHFPLLIADAKTATTYGTMTPLNWTKLPELNAKDGSITGYDDLVCGFSDTQNGDYLVVLTFHGFRTAAEFQKALTSVMSNASYALLQTDVPLPAQGWEFYPDDAARAASLQSASYTWLQTIAPAISFDPSRGVTVDQSITAPLAGTLCAKGEAELKSIITFLSGFSWAKDYQLLEMPQRNLDVLEAAHDTAPSVTTSTYAVDGTVQRTTTGNRLAAQHNLLTAALYAALGLAVGLLFGLLLPRHGRKEPAQQPV